MTVHIKDFIQAVKSVSLAVPKFSAREKLNPIFKCILIEDNQISSPAHYGHQITQKIELGHCLEPFAVDAKEFLTRLKLVPKNAVIWIKTTDKVSTVHWQGGSFPIPTLPSADFPGRLPWPDNAQDNTVKISMDSALFREALERLVPAMSYKDIRYYLNGLCLDLKQTGCKMLSTDGHRLHCLDADFINRGYLGDGVFTLYSGPDLEVILQDQHVHWLIKTLPKVGQVSITVGYRNREGDYEKHITIEYGDLVIRCKSADGKFPDYQRVIPSDLPYNFQVDRKSLIQIVKNVGSLCKGKFHPIALSFQGLDYLSVKYQNLEGESYREQAKIESKELPADFEMGINPGYLLDAIQACTSDKITVQVRSQTDAILIEDGNFKAVIMPCRLLNRRQ